MPVKRANSGKTVFLKKSKKKPSKHKKHPFANPPHAPYEKRIYQSVEGMLNDVTDILNQMNQAPNDPNRAPTVGLIQQLNALLQELKYGSSDLDTHQKNIEEILYSIGEMCDQYSISGQTPPTKAYPPPSGGTHEDRVLKYFTTIDSICREILDALGVVITSPQPTPGSNVDDNIVAMASDTQMVVRQIKKHIDAFYSIDILSK